MRVFSRRVFGALQIGLAVLCAGSFLVGQAHAVPVSEVFSLNQADPQSGIPAGGWGTVTLTQNSIDEVDVLVSLGSGVLFVNTGGPHTPFAFNLNTSLPNGSITVLAPVGTTACSPAASPCFTPTYTSEPGTPFGTFSQGFDYSGHNGGVGHGNPGPLHFTIDAPGIGTVTSGGLFSDFVANDKHAIFAADLYVPTNTGTVASFVGSCTTGCGTNDTPIPTPEPASLALVGVALAGLGLVQRRRRI